MRLEEESRISTKTGGFQNSIAAIDKLWLIYVLVIYTLYDVCQKYRQL